MPRSRKNKLKVNEKVNNAQKPEMTIEAERVRECAGPARDYSQSFQKTPYEKMLLKLAKRMAREAEAEKE